MYHLKNQTILLTGASGGFGVHFMRELLSRGCQIIPTDIDAARLASIASSIKSEVGRGEIIACLGADLSSIDGVEGLWLEVESLNRPINVLINNAGIALLGRHDEVPTDKWQQLLQINLIAPMKLTELVLPQMISRRSGTIINISSLAGWTSDVGLSAYSASKFGLRGFSEALADDVRPFNVQVSVVYPFYSDTPILDSPQYGTLNNMREPTAELKSRLPRPEDVVANALKGVEKGQEHIFPDGFGRIIYFTKRYFPATYHLLRVVMNRLM